MCFFQPGERSGRLGRAHARGTQSTTKAVHPRRAAAQPGLCDGAVRGGEETSRRCPEKVAPLEGEGAEGWELLQKPID